MNTISELLQEESQEKVDKIRAGIDLIDELVVEIKTKSRKEQESSVQQIIDEVAIWRFS